MVQAVNVAMLGLTALAGIALIGGLALLAVGWRGRRLDRHPVCRKCRFDLDGVFPGREVCPECGAGLESSRAVRVGNRRRRRGMIAAGVLALVVGLGGVGAGGFASTRNVQWVRLKPAWLLAIDARGADATSASTALAELARRIPLDALSEERIRTLVSDALQRQADEGTGWLSEWGDVVEAARQADLVSDEDWGTYLESAVVVSFQARTRQHAGGDVRYHLELTPGRLGTRSQIRMHATDVQVSIADLEWEWQRSGLLNVSPGGASWTTHRHAVPELAPGLYRLRAAFEVGLSEARALTDEPEVIVEHEATVMVELVGPDVELVSVVDDEPALERLRAGLRADPIRLTMREKDIGAHWQVMFGPRDYALGFDVFIRDEEGREWPAGGIVLPAGGGQHGIGVSSTLPLEVEGDAFEMVLRASPRRGEESMSTIDEILGGSLTIPVKAEWAEE